MKPNQVIPIEAHMTMAYQQSGLLVHIDPPDVYACIWQLTLILTKSGGLLFITKVH